MTFPARSCHGLRRRLPDRRIATHMVVEWAERRWLIGIGWFEDGTVGELFGDGVKTGTELEGLVDDACVSLSLNLQAGWSPLALAEAMGGSVDDPASLYAVILHRAAALETAESAAIAHEYQQAAMGREQVRRDTVAV